MATTSKRSTHASVIPFRVSRYGVMTFLLDYGRQISTADNVMYYCTLMDMRIGIQDMLVLWVGLQSQPKTVIDDRTTKIDQISDDFNTLAY